MCCLGLRKLPNAFRFGEYLFGLCVAPGAFWLFDGKHKSIAQPMLIVYSDRTKSEHASAECSHIDEVGEMASGQHGIAVWNAMSETDICVYIDNAAGQEFPKQQHNPLPLCSHTLVEGGNTCSRILYMHKVCCIRICAPVRTFPTM